MSCPRELFVNVSKCVLQQAASMKGQAPSSQPQQTQPSGPGQSHIHLTQPPQLGVYRGGSLPNVNQMASTNSIDLQVSYLSTHNVT